MKNIFFSIIKIIIKTREIIGKKRERERERETETERKKKKRE
jgi:hypothetical protein